MSPDRRRTLLRTVVISLAVFLGMVAGAFLNRWPAWGTTRHAYCTMCGVHNEESERTPVLGRHRQQSMRAGILAKLIAPVVGDHGHAWSIAAYVAPTNPPPKLGSREAFTQVVAEAEVRELELLEDSPHAIALLDEAMRNDKPRAVKFIQKLLDPQAYLPVEAIGLLDRPSQSWEERWQVVDAFLNAYHCDVTEVSASCRMRAGSTDLLVLVRTTTSVHSGGVDWTHWVPPGMKAPPGGTSPQTYAAVTLSD
jgi:hypothetical protein